MAGISYKVYVLFRTEGRRHASPYGACLIGFHSWLSLYLEFAFRFQRPFVIYKGHGNWDKQVHRTEINESR
jgi:hypothetical protein